MWIVDGRFATLGTPIGDPLAAFMMWRVDGVFACCQHEYISEQA
jgi:hypothetical protein